VHVYWEREDRKWPSEMHEICHEIVLTFPLCVYSHGPIILKVISQNLLGIQLESLDLTRDTAALANHQSEWGYVKR